MVLGLNTVCDVYFAGAIDLLCDEWSLTPDVAGAPGPHRVLLHLGKGENSTTSVLDKYGDKPPHRMHVTVASSRRAQLIRSQELSPGSMIKMAMPCLHCEPGVG